jgi:hypothetical protein
MNLYETTTLLKAVENFKPVNTFLRDCFFPQGNNETLLTKTALIDVKRGKRRIAPFVAPKVGGVTINRDGFKTYEITTPLIAPQRNISSNDVEARSLGESIISTKTPDQRQYGILAKDLSELDESITRREELMVSDLLFNNKIEIKAYIDTNGDRTQDSVVTFGDKTEDKVTKLWSAADADILKDLRDLRRKIMQESGVNPNIVVMGAKVFDALVDNEKFLKLLDIRNLQIANIAPQFRNNDAVTYVGRLTALGIDIYTYDEWYMDDEGKDQPMVPEDKILIGARNLGGFKYGAITQMEQRADDFKTYAATRVPKYWSNHESNQRMIRLSSRPLPVPYDIAAWKVVKVV